MKMKKNGYDDERRGWERWGGWKRVHGVIV